jgi:hypothetical protein
MQVLTTTLGSFPTGERVELAPRDGLVFDALVVLAQHEEESNQ